MERIAVAALAFALAFLTCGVAMASDVERQITGIRDSEGSGLTIEISREGTRRTATPYLTLYEPTVQRIEDRIVNNTARSAEKGAPSGATAPDSRSRLGLTGTPPADSERPETTVASLPALPGEITIRNVKNFLKGLRSSRKEKPAPAVGAPDPELRLGMVDTTPH